MDRWRTIGFVPDSEDEEELDSQQTRVPVEGQVEDDIIHHDSVGVVPGSQLNDKPDDDNKTKGGRAGRPNRPQPQVVIEISNHRKPTNSSPAINDVEEFGTDPLQDDGDLTEKSPKEGQLELAGEATANTRTLPRPSTQVEDEPPSSPDELHFQQHFPSRHLTTPVRQSPHDVLVPQESSSSSPLSSPPSNLASPWSFHFATPNAAGAGEERNLGVPGIAPGIDETRAFGGPPQSTSHGRALRPRNPAQLNPFRLEIAMYEKSCREAGIVPERMRSFIRQQSPGYQGAPNDGQGDSAPPSSSPSQSFRYPPDIPSVPKPRDTKRIRNRRSSSDRIRSTHANEKMPTQSVPESRLSTRNITYKGFKRRRLNHPGERTGEQSPSVTARASTEAEVANGAGSNIPGDTSIFDMPMSPPPSGSPTITPADQENPEFRFPPDYSPPPVPTPVTEQRPSHVAKALDNPILLDSSSPSDAEQSLILQGDVEGQSVSEPSEDETHGMKSMRRRIKGVLPASWIRLDRQEQERRTKAQAEKERLARMRNDRQSGKGVAQKITTNRRAANLRPTAFLPSEDSDSENDNGHLLSAQRPALQPIDNPPGLDEDDDIPEDNRIDTMSPPAMRRRQNSSKKKNPKPKVTDNAPSQHRLRQSRIIDGGSRKGLGQNPQLRVPKLGILDAPDVQKRPTKNQPQFLRVALRRARSRRNQGRSSPTRKVFRLANRRDTEDANLSLRQWREGTIAPTTGHGKVGSRQYHPEPQIQPSIHRHFDREDSVQLTGPESDRAMPPVRATPRSGRYDTRENSDTVETPLCDKADRPSEVRNQTQINHDLLQRAGARKGFVLSSLRRNIPRPADLDYLSTSSIGPQPTSSFKQSLSALNASYKDTKSARNLARNLPLARFLSIATDTPKAAQQPNSISTRNSDGHQHRTKVPTGKATRKRQPQRLNADALQHHQSPVSQSDITGPASVSFASPADAPPLKGVQSVVRTASVDFDTSTLEVGTYFHESTFIGSGDFSRSLSVSSRDMDVHNNHTTISYKGDTYYWGYWNETVSSEAEILFDAIIEPLNDFSCRPGQDYVRDAISKSSELYKSLIRYVNDSLSFMDPIDRRMFVDKGLRLLSKATDIGCDYSQNGNSNQVMQHQVLIEALNLVFANQVRQIAVHKVVDRAKLNTAMDFIMMIGCRVFNMMVTDAGTKNIRRALDENKLRGQREAGIKEEYPFVEAFLIVRQIIYNQTAVKVQSKDDPFSKALTTLLPSKVNDVNVLEKIWFTLFSVQPLRELDEFGILQQGLRFRELVSQWKVVNQLVSKSLEWYEASRRAHSPSLNNYLRTLFLRCFKLIEDWGWHHCKPILETLFDFFAKNALHNLHNEETRGSPGFLDELNRRVRIEVDSRDSCFHVLLKIVAVGLRAMSGFCDKKHMRNLAWRLLPNHGRTYPKDEPLRREDLDALRNHHDLLCTLYSSTSPGCRPPLKTIRQLVHPASSHKEACSINIRAWLRLVKYKIWTKEGESDLEEFADWHNEFTTAVVKQHSFARTEIERQNNLGSFVNSRVVEDAISKNQRQVESLISDALVYLKMAIGLANDMSEAKVLVGKLPVERVLDLFDPKSRRVGEVICHALDVIVAYTSKAQRSSAPEPVAAVNTSEDSQEYGDWTIFNEICDSPEQFLHPGINYIDNVIRPTLSKFVSRCFGEDVAPDDSVLLAVIHCWSSVVSVLVRHGLRQGRSYLNPYDGDSWLSLRSTDQTRRFMPYFVATLVEKDLLASGDCQAQLLSCWLISLVERGSMLKYQHEITNALLNANGRDNPLFKNLPFSVNKLSGRYEISLDEICQRRLSLISCVLSNMRVHLFNLEQRDIEAGKAIRSQYVDMIRSLMTAMKQNYEELGNSSEPVFGSYVEFVHRIVEFLQQHSQDICSLDAFFTDPKAFPLPASDPTYIAARLKSYGVRLNTAKAAKPLASFIQAVTQRAVLDAQQNYLVDQLYNATSVTSHDEDYQSPSLRTFLLQCIYPAYVENSFTTPAAWLLVQPLLRSTTRLFADLILDLDATNQTRVSTLLDSMCVYFEAVDHSLQILPDHPGMLEEPSFLLTLTSFLETVVSSLTLIDYLERLSGKAARLVAYVEHFRQFVLFAVSFLHDPATATAPETFDTVLERYDGDLVCRHPSISPPTYFAETRNFATYELRSWLRNGLSSHEGKYYVRQGPRSKEVNVGPLDASVARGAFVRTVETFFGLIQRLEAFDFLRIEVQGTVPSRQDDDSCLAPLI